MAYSSDQIAQYLTAVGLPQKFHPEAPQPVSRDIELLSLLYAHQISTVPYENLSLHYRHPDSITSAYGHYTTSGAYMNIDPDYLFDKFVTRGHGRGGYCFQVVTFFAYVLRGMGFQHVYTAQARIRLRDSITGLPLGDYVGFRHATNIVTLDDNSRWSCDVSFGGDGPIQPLPLIHGYVTQNIGTQQLRLIKDHIPEQHDKTNAGKLWIYQYRNSTTNADGSERPWNSYYAFPELEYVAADLQLANWYTSQFPESFQTKQVIVVKFLHRRKPDDRSDSLSTDDFERREIYGKIMLATDVVKRNTGGKTEVILTCKSEIERLKALEEYFGIRLFPEEIKGIINGSTELVAAVGQD